MTVVRTVASAPVGDGTSVERLVGHPRLPMVAALDAARPAVHIWDCAWDCAAGTLRELGIVGAESDDYGDADGWQRWTRTPAVAWHPDQPLLLISGEDGVLGWSPAGLAELDGLPRSAAYRSMAFSPDGQTVWASPASRRSSARTDVTSRFAATRTRTRLRCSRFRHCTGS